MEDFERHGNFEQKLRDALARKEQPTSFEAGVFAAIAAGASSRRSFWRWEAVAASVLMASAFWAQHEHARRDRAAGEAAKSRLQLALKITVAELSKIQRTVRTSTEE
jgi:hypothetical protein